MRVVSVRCSVFRASLPSFSAICVLVVGTAAAGWVEDGLGGRWHGDGRIANQLDNRYLLREEAGVTNALTATGLAEVRGSNVFVSVPQEVLTYVPWEQFGTTDLLTDGMGTPGVLASYFDAEDNWVGDVTWTWSVTHGEGYDVYGWANEDPDPPAGAVRGAWYSEYPLALVTDASGMRLHGLDIDAALIGIPAGYDSLDLSDSTYFEPLYSCAPVPVGMSYARETASEGWAGGTWYLGCLADVNPISAPALFGVRINRWKVLQPVPAPEFMRVLSGHETTNLVAAAAVAGTNYTDEVALTKADAGHVTDAGAHDALFGAKVGTAPYAAKMAALDAVDYAAQRGWYTVRSYAAPAHAGTVTVQPGVSEWVSVANTGLMSVALSGFPDHNATGAVLHVAFPGSGSVEWETAVWWAREPPSPPCKVHLEYERGYTNGVWVGWQDPEIRGTGAVKYAAVINRTQAPATPTNGQGVTFSAVARGFNGANVTNLYLWNRRVGDAVFTRRVASNLAGTWSLVTNNAPVGRYEYYWQAAFNDLTRTTPQAFGSGYFQWTMHAAYAFRESPSDGAYQTGDLDLPSGWSASQNWMRTVQGPTGPHFGSFYQYGFLDLKASNTEAQMGLCTSPVFAGGVSTIRAAIYNGGFGTGAWNILQHSTDGGTTWTSVNYGFSAYEFLDRTVTLRNPDINRIRIRGYCPPGGGGRVLVGVVIVDPY